MREIKFRAWNNLKKVMWYPTNIPQGQFGCFLYESSLMQFTGIKDKNGVDVYEGDIIKLAQFNIEIKWVNEFSRFTNKDDYTGFISKNILVIGNICENPKLLTAGD